MNARRETEKQNEVSRQPVHSLHCALLIAHSTENYPSIVDPKEGLEGHFERLECLKNRASSGDRGHRLLVIPGVCFPLG